MGSLAMVALSIFESLPARPPTPPKETSYELGTNQKEILPSHAVHAVPDSKPSIQTPPNVHTPSSITAGSSRRKKVEFSSQAEYRDAPLYSADENARHHPTPISNPPSSSAPLPGKSILKVPVTYGPNPLDPTNGTGPDGLNLANMLESTVQQLAGADRDMKLDAYTSLARALRASNNLPDRIALQEKMTLFMHFIQRDITCKTASGSPDASLANHAFTLLSTFLHFPAIASTLSNEFGVFVIEHGIKNLEDAALSKDMARHLMTCIALQNFSPKVISSDRVGKLVAALHNLPDHIKDKKGVYMSRINIYRRLLKQAKHAMIHHSDWLLDLFEAMLSGIKEIRSTAISLGMDAAFMSIQEKHLSKKVMELLQQPAPSQEASTYMQYYAEVLRRMTKDKEKLDSRSVPQIWSIVILFYRGLDKSAQLNEWLHIIQDCFNCQDFTTKQEALFAWSRLAYSMNAGGRSCSPKFISILTAPLPKLLKRRGPGKPLAKHADELRTVVLGSIRTLYYYTFRPNANMVHLETYWDISVKPVMQVLTEQRLEDDKDSCIQACTILTWLFNSSVRRVWADSHIVENPLTAPEELPALDAKWLRRNVTRVLSVVEPILRKNFDELCNTRSAVYKLWETLIGAAALAASKEIKVSADMAAFLGQVFGVLFQIWADGVPQSTRSDNGSSVKFLASAREFILVMVDKLGRLPFTEKVLAMSAENNALVPVSTPSHRSGANQLSSRPTIHHLFSILSTLPPGVPDNGEFVEFFRSIFTAFLEDRNAKNRRKLAQDLLQLIPMNALCPAGPWVLIAETLATSLEASQKGGSELAPSSSSGDSSVGQEYREVVKVLERGLRSTPNLSWQSWQSLFSTLRDRAKTDSGDAGLAIAVVEPLARILLDQMPEKSILTANDLAAFGELLTSSTHPRDRQAVDAARRRLWGTVASGPRSASSDPFDNLYRLSNTILGRLYDEFDQHDPDESVAPVLNEITAFLGRCNRQLVVQTLGLLQDSLATWIRDDQTKLDSLQFPKATEATKVLWDRVSALINSVEQPEALPLASVETLLCAAFESKHRHIVNSVSTMWNNVFEKVEGMAYPDKLKNVLLSRKSFVDIVLPGLEPSSSAEFGAQRPTFIDSQIDMDVLNTLSTTRSKSTGHVSSGSALKESRSSNGEAQLRDKGRHHTSGVTKASSSSKGRKNNATPTPKLRHDDSQIQFAPIDTSPSDQLASESQVLTERQKEIRDRQREAALMFPEMRSSSPGLHTDGVEKPVPSEPARSHQTQEPDDISSPGLPRAATPQAENRFEDYVSSTPTPRRGQPPPLPDNYNGISDPPSSPPEPRPFPLLPEIRSRASSDSLLDAAEWDFSSPISGSPSAAHHRQPIMEGPAEGEDEMHIDETAADETSYELPPPETSFENTERLPAPDAENVAAAGDPEKRPTSRNSRTGSRSTTKPAREAPSTPRRSLRTRASQETPKSDNNEVFMDALTSPQPSSSPSKSKATDKASSQNESFQVSDGEERSLVRLVVQLDGKTENPTNFIEPTPSPSKQTTGRQSKPQTQQPHPEAEDEAEADPEPEQEPEPEPMECITVGGTSKRGRGRPRRYRSARASSEAAVETPGSSQEPTPSGRPKRKRSASKVVEQESPGPKKTKHRAAEVERETEPEPKGVPDSQPGPVVQVTGRALLLVQMEEYDRSSSGPSHESLRNTEDEEGRDEDEELQTVQGAKETRAEASQTKMTAQAIMAMLKGGLDALKTAKISRSEMNEIEDVFVDMKHELYAAVKRGRNGRK